ncbi:MAG: trigger factor [Bacteroidia bacterium]
MNITLEKTGDLTSEIKIHLLSEDYKTKVEEELKKQARKASIPGFRPGKVPLGMVRKMVGKAVVIDEVTKTISDSLHNYITENNLNILGEPLVKEELTDEDFDVNCEKEVELIFELGLAPEFELNLNLAEPLKKYAIEIDEEYLNKEIENLRDRYSDVSNPEIVEEKDILYGKLFEVNENGEPVEEGFEKMVALNHERVENQDIFPPFNGKAIGDALPLSPFDLAESRKKVAEILFVSEDELNNLEGKTFHFQIKRINRLTKAALNEDFFKKVGSANGWEEEFTEEAPFMEKLKETFRESFTGSTQWFLQQQAQKQLVEANPLTFPEEFLKKWLKKTNKDTSEEVLEEQLPEMLKSLNWTLIVDKINKLYPETLVKEEELRDEMKAYFRERYSHMEELNDETRLDELVNYTFQNEELLRMHVKRTSEDKLFSKLSEVILPVDETISATGFMKLVEEK